MAVLDVRAVCYGLKRRPAVLREVSKKNNNLILQERILKNKTLGAVDEYTLNDHNVRSCVHRGDAEDAERTQRVVKFS